MGLTSSTTTYNIIWIPKLIGASARTKQPAQAAAAPNADDLTLFGRSRTARLGDYCNSLLRETCRG
jgi:hypothetical protein